MASHLAAAILSSITRLFVSRNQSPFLLDSFFGKFLIIALCWTFSFHILNELRHLFWDLGYGFDLKIAKITGVLALIGSFILTILFITLSLK